MQINPLYNTQLLPPKIKMKAISRGGRSKRKDVLWEGFSYTSQFFNPHKFRYQTKRLIIYITLCYSVIVMVSLSLLYFLGSQNCVVSNGPVYVIHYNVFADI